MTYARHGDVPLHPLSAIPEGAEKIKHDGSFTVAFGEQTNHHHTLYASKKEDMEVYKVGQTFFVSLKVDVPLRHQEHKEIVIPRGIYGIGMEVEYDPFMKHLTKVVD